MNTKLFSEVMNEINDKYYEEAANYQCKKHGWTKWSVVAACFAVALFTAFSVVPNSFHQQDNIPPDNPNGVIVDHSTDNQNEDTTPATSEIHVSMDHIFLNEVGALLDAARIWRDLELCDYIQWDRNDIIDYYGKDLTPVYVPDGLTAAIGNGTASVIADQRGNIVEDTVQLSFYHDYYFPWLLSWRAYYVVKSKRMQKLLISGQFNRNRDTRTAPEDRNKMAFVGFVMWGANLIFTVATCSILIFLLVMSLFLSNTEVIALAERVAPLLFCFLNMEYFCFISIMPILYLLDYGIGKYFYFKRP